MAVYAKTYISTYIVGREKKVKEVSNAELQYRHFFSQIGEEGGRK